MIIDLFLNLFFGIATRMMSPLGKITWLFDISSIQPVLEVLRMVGYILPIKEFLPIIAFFIATMILRIAISLIKTIWSLLPLL